MDKFNEKEPIIKGSGGDGGGYRGGSTNALMVTITHSGHCCFNARWGFEIYKVNTLRALSYENCAITHSPFRSPAAKIYFD